MFKPSLKFRSYIFILEKFNEIQMKIVLLYNSFSYFEIGGLKLKYAPSNNNSFFTEMGIDRIYDEDEYVEENLRSRKYQFAGFSGWRIDGTWMNKKYTAGGAFQSFAFYDEETQQAFLIDNSVYYPEGFKLDALIELELISETIQLK